MSDIHNYIQMTDLVGTSGQPTREQFKEIAGNGYKTVINLAMPDSKNAIADEGAVVTSLGMQYIHIPVPFDNPTVNHLKTFVGIMRSVEGEKVWVHCAVNARVSAFMYQYLRIEKGFDTASAKNSFLKKWEPTMDSVWGKFLSLDKVDLE